MTEVSLSVPNNLEAITNEADFQRLVVETLLLMGWTVIHIKEMFGNPKGVPDLLAFRRGRGEMIELKIGKRQLSPGQVRWQERSLGQGTTVHLVRNSQEDWERLMSIMREGGA